MFSYSSLTLTSVQVNTKYNELKELWVKIKESSALRKQKLEESFKYHKFLVHYRDLGMEMERLETLFDQKKEPRDVAEAVVFLDEHDQYMVSTYFYFLVKYAF